MFINSCNIITENFTPRRRTGGEACAFFQTRIFARKIHSPRWFKPARSRWRIFYNFAPRAGSSCINFIRAYRRLIFFYFPYLTVCLQTFRAPKLVRRKIYAHSFAVYNTRETLIQPKTCYKFIPQRWNPRTNYYGVSRLLVPSIRTKFFSYKNGGREIFNENSKLFSPSSFTTLVY